jgi:hypothetical protein
LGIYKGRDPSYVVWWFLGVVDRLREEEVTRSTKF